MSLNRFLSFYKAKDGIINKKGFTLVELIVTIALISVIMGVFYSMFSYNNNVYKDINERIDVQNEFRFIMSYLEKQISTAETITLTQSIEEPVPANYINLYVLTTGGKGSLVKKEVSSVTNPINSSNIQNLTIQFKIKSGTIRNIINIKLQADGGYVLEREVLAQNDENGDENADPNTLYSVIKLNPYN